MGKENVRRTSKNEKSNEKVETEKKEETEESEMMKRKLKHHNNDEFKTSDVYLHVVGDKE